MKLSGALARRGNEPVGRYCPIERSLLVVGHPLRDPGAP